MPIGFIDTKDIGKLNVSSMRGMRRKAKLENEMSRK